MSLKACNAVLAGRSSLVSSVTRAILPQTRVELDDVAVILRFWTASDDLPGIQAFQLRHAQVVILCVEDCSREELHRCNTLSATLHHASHVPVILLYTDVNHARALFLAASIHAASYIQWTGDASVSLLYHTIAHLSQSHVVPSWPQLGSDEVRDIEDVLRAAVRAREWPFTTEAGLLAAFRAEPPELQTLGSHEQTISTHPETPPPLPRTGPSRSRAATPSGPLRSARSGLASSRSVDSLAGLGGLTRVPTQSSALDAASAPPPAAAPATGTAAAAAAAAATPAPAPTPVATPTAGGLVATPARLQPAWDRYFASMSLGQPVGVLQAGADSAQTPPPPPPPSVPDTAGAAVASAPAASGRDWFDEFLVTLRLSDADPQASIVRAQAMERYRSAFATAASTAARSLIRYRAGTAAPGGGVAGGDKVLVSGLFTKVSTDAMALYGSEAAAAKAVGHEARAAAAVIALNSELVAPPTAAVQYRGTALLVSAKLPLSAETHVYGSSDGGGTAVDRSPAMREAMRAVGRALNLRPHIVARGDGDAVGGQEVALAGDVEGHELLTPRGRVLVAVDLARTFPAEMPVAGLAGAVLRHQLRPELVRKNPVPLSSDAFSRWGAHNARALNDDVVAATLRLLTSAVVRAASRLDAGERDVASVLHAEGVNLRYLNVVRSRLIRPSARAAVAFEMVARAAKNELRDILRPVAADDALCVRLAVHMLNAIVGTGLATDTFYRHQLPARLRQMYEYFTSDPARMSQIDRPLLSAVLRGDEISTLPRLALLRRVAQSVGVQIRREAYLRLLQTASAFDCEEPLKEADVEDVVPRVKPLLFAPPLGTVLRAAILGADRLPTPLSLPHDQCGALLNRVLTLVALLEESGSATETDVVPALVLAVRLALRLGDLKCAQTLSTRALERVPEYDGAFVSALEVAALVALRQGQIAAAEAFCQRAVSLADRLNVSATDALVRLARVYRVTKRPALALETARRALTLLTARYGPESSQLWPAWLELSRIGDMESAQRLLGVLQRSDPDGLATILHAKVFRMLARAAASRQCVQDSLTYLDRGLAGPCNTHARAWAACADVTRKLGLSAAALHAQIASVLFTAPPALPRAVAALVESVEVVELCGATNAALLAQWLSAPAAGVAVPPELLAGAAGLAPPTPLPPTAVPAGSGAGPTLSGTATSVLSSAAQPAASTPSGTSSAVGTLSGGTGGSGGSGSASGLFSRARSDPSSLLSIFSRSKSNSSSGSAGGGTGPASTPAGASPALSSLPAALQPLDGGSPVSTPPAPISSPLFGVTASPASTVSAPEAVDSAPAAGATGSVALPLSAVIAVPTGSGAATATGAAATASGTASASGPAAAAAPAAVPTATPGGPAAPSAASLELPDAPVSRRDRSPSAATLAEAERGLRTAAVAMLVGVSRTMAAAATGTSAAGSGAGGGAVGTPSESSTLPARLVADDEQLAGLWLALLGAACAVAATPAPRASDSDEQYRLDRYVPEMLSAAEDAARTRRPVQAWRLLTAALLFAPRLVLERGHPVVVAVSAWMFGVAVDRPVPPEGAVFAGIEPWQLTATRIPPPVASTLRQAFAGEAACGAGLCAWRLATRLSDQVWLMEAMLSAQRDPLQLPEAVFAAVLRGETLVLRVAEAEGADERRARAAVWAAYAASRAATAVLQGYGHRAYSPTMAVTVLSFGSPSCATVVDTAVRTMRYLAAQCGATLVPGPAGLVLFTGGALRAPLLLRAHPRGTTVQLWVPLVELPTGPSRTRVLRLALRFSAPYTAIVEGPTSGLLFAVSVVRIGPGTAPPALAVLLRRLLVQSGLWQRALFSLTLDRPLLTARGKRRGRRMLLWRATLFSLHADRLSYTDADQTAPKSVDLHEITDVASEGVEIQLKTATRSYVCSFASLSDAQQFGRALVDLRSLIA